MSHLPILLLLLLVSPGLQAAPTQTMPLKTTQVNCSNLREEIVTLLNQPPLASSNFNNLNREDQRILMKPNLRKPNLEAFQKAVKSLQNAAAIESNLKDLPVCLPTATNAATQHPIRIKDGDWNDFQMKLKFYLKTLEIKQPQ
uniref:Interleukin-3 n=2 Tax=Callithrix jacchus TaxID=9483 RepID=IL3_CALJA|nr:RecName: Full=Interleukin-3; Short=IL-3; AltName: Full=Hematopoietic growth factor; AltName: Full=Mast cell growth factor; Short=MCGF; AltName: Full=Multipotential colony-stimulating factor; AltName: Full=P-cell-stimulating factor; Flags: Precursor [Callithrix jacchus]ABZ10513.1 interleukin-3 precursor (predicted) [Callithrix jacchus]CAA52864.1 interleukin-3 [Callithrix jacchus]